MNLKTIAIAVIFATLLCATASIVTSSDDLDAANGYVEVTVVSAGNGTVNSAEVDGRYYDGQSFTVRATPNNGYMFSYWEIRINGSQTATSMENPHTFTVEDPSVTSEYSYDYIAHFVQNASAFATFVVESDGHGTVTGGGTFVDGERCRMEASPNTGYKFKNWEVRYSFQSGVRYELRNPITYYITTGDYDRTYYFKAIFEEVRGVVVKVRSAGNGTVTNVSGTYYQGESYTILATPNPGYVFQSWTLIINDSMTTSFSQNPHTNTIEYDPDYSQEYSYTYIANFVPGSVNNLIVTTANDGSGGTRGGGTYAVGESFTLTAVPDYGYEFVEWSCMYNNDPSTSFTVRDNPYISTVTSAQGGKTLKCTAVFELIQPILLNVEQFYSMELKIPNRQPTELIGEVPGMAFGYTFGGSTSGYYCYLEGYPTTVGNYTLKAYLNTSLIGEWNVIVQDARTLTVTITTNGGGSVSTSEVMVEPGTTIHVWEDKIDVWLTEVYAFPDADYVFDKWSVPDEYVVTTNVTIYAEFRHTSPITLTVGVQTNLLLCSTDGYTMNGGQPPGTSVRTVGGAYYLIGTPTMEGTYTLKYTTPSDEDDWTIIVRPSVHPPIPVDADVWWANGYANNKVTVVFDFEKMETNYAHRMHIPLIQYNKNVTDTTDGMPRYFELSGETLVIECAYKSYVKITIGNYTTTHNPGIWQRYALIIDTQTSKITFQGISSIMRNPTSDFNFLDYNSVTSTVIADWAAVTTDKAIYRIYHEDYGTGTDHVRFQANATSTFLDTYGFVMIDPTINIAEYFPSYENIRLNLYSFALYGDSITINNMRFVMDGSQITVRYDEIISLGSKHIVASPTGSLSFTTTLTNIYITWENIQSSNPDERQCYLTFVDDKKTFEMGTFAKGDLTISGKGMWYFTTAVWSPYTAYEKSYSMDWNSPFNISPDGFILIFIAIAIITLVAMNVIWQPTFLDYVVVVGGCVISYVMLGFIW